MSTAFEVYGESFAAGWAPEPRTTVSEWADAHRILDPRSSAEHGRWRTSRVPYMRKIMDDLSTRSPIRTVVFMKGSQIAATEGGNNWLGYIMHHAPGPTLLMMPTGDNVRKASNTRIDPMIQTTPALAARVTGNRSRDATNTTLYKEFPGGYLAMIGANSGAGLRQISIRYLMLDEVDGYPADVDGEGDPVKLAEKRTGTFQAVSKTYIVSTPTLRHLSRIERAFKSTDQQRYYIPCPHCGTMDFLTWSGPDWHGGTQGSHHRINWDKEGERHLPETAHMVCSGCAGRVEEHHKTWMLAAGSWSPTCESSSPTLVGYHLSSLYSPLGWRSWAQCATEFLEAEGNPHEMKVFVNTVLGETFEEYGAGVEPEILLRRLEDYGRDAQGRAIEVPHGVGILVGSVDVQDDRLEVKIKGYGAGEESWLIAVARFEGDPASSALWFEMDEMLKRKWLHASGRMIAAECVAVDSGGHHTEQVYKFTKLRQARRVYAIKGGNIQGQPLVAKPTKHNRYGCRLYILCTDTGKEVVYARLAIPSKGAGFCHLPKRIMSDLEWEEYVAQLASEKAIRKSVPGRGSVKTWKKIRERNEALDLEVYALAALYMRAPFITRDLAGRAAALSRPLDGEDPAGPPTFVPPPLTPPPGSSMPTAAQLRARQGWMTSWKK